MDWEVGSNALACSACKQSFVEEQEIFSALYDEQTAFLRRDFCNGCWSQQDRAAIFSHWQTRIPKKDAPVKRFVDDEIVLEFFRKLEGQDEPLKKNFRYVLALLLMRKKALKFIEFKRTEAGAMLILRDALSQSDYHVADPDLNEEQIQQVTEEIGQILNTKIA